MTLHCTKCGYLRDSVSDPLCLACAEQEVFLTTGATFRDYANAARHCVRLAKSTGLLGRVWESRKGHKRYVSAEFKVSLPRALWSERKCYMGSEFVA